MKKLFLIALPLMLFACKKQYTCNCVTSISGEESTVTEMIEANKKDAQDICEQRSKTINVIHTIKCELQ